jgi:uncharacterized membrane protein YgdD (TMEM256/DUF423 family)
MSKYLRIVGLIGALAVILGAFGAHALKENLSVDRLAAYKTGILYHFIHCVAMFCVAILIDKYNLSNLKRAFTFFGLGILLFSGSLYLLTTQDLLGINLSILGPITPIGGLFFILGWVYLVLPNKKYKV